jgi:protease I
VRRVCAAGRSGSGRSMAGELNGMRVAVLATDGVEQVELDRPWQALEEAGAEPELVSLEAGTITAYDHIDKGDTRKVDSTVADADPDVYAALVLPGGVINGDFVRADADAVAFVKAFFDAGKPVAAICHASWVLAEADVVRGRRMTSWPSLQTDLRNAGATWVDEEVVVDGNLITSRKPDDLDAFGAAIVEEFAAARDGAEADATA